MPGVLAGAVVRVKYLPDPHQFKIFVAAVLLYIGLRMIGDLRKKNTGTDAKAQSEKKIQELVKRHRAGANGHADPANCSAVGLTIFNLRR